MFRILTISVLLLSAGCIVNTPGLSLWKSAELYNKEAAFRNPLMPLAVDYAELDRRTLQGCEEIHIFKVGKVGYLRTIYAPWYDKASKRHLRRIYEVLDKNTEEIGYFTPNGRTFMCAYNDRKDIHRVFIGQYPRNESIRKLLKIEGELSLVALDIDWILSDEYPNPRKKEATNLKELRGDEDEDEY